MHIRIAVSLITIEYRENGRLSRHILQNIAVDAAVAADQAAAPTLVKYSDFLDVIWPCGLTVGVGNHSRSPRSGHAILAWRRFFGITAMHPHPKVFGLRNAYLLVLTVDKCITFDSYYVIDLFRALYSGREFVPELPWAIWKLLRRWTNGKRDGYHRIREVQRKTDWPGCCWRRLEREKLDS